MVAWRLRGTLGAPTIGINAPVEVMPGRKADHAAAERQRGGNQADQGTAEQSTDDCEAVLA